MSSLPRKKKNRVTDAPVKSLDLSETLGLNVPVGTDKAEGWFEKAREVHQHATIKHVVMLVHDDESIDVGCLFCGGHLQIQKPYAKEMDNEAFRIFKSFHMGCVKPAKPLGYFNVDMQKKNPRYVNKGSGVTVELVNIKTSKTTGAEQYQFFDVKNPEVILAMSKAQFEEFFIKDTQA